MAICGDPIGLSFHPHRETFQSRPSGFFQQNQAFHPCGWGRRRALGLSMVGRRGCWTQWGPYFVLGGILAPPISTFHPQTLALRCTRYLHDLSRKGRRCCGEVLLQRHLPEFSTYFVITPHELHVPQAPRPGCRHRESCAIETSQVPLIH